MNRALSSGTARLTDAGRPRTLPGSAGRTARSADCHTIHWWVGWTWEQDFVHFRVTDPAGTGLWYTLDSVHA